MGTATRTRLLVAAFCVSLCGLGLTAGAHKLAQVTDAQARVIDDGDAGFTQSGFRQTSYKDGYQGDTYYTSPRTIAAASWEFKNLSAGTYDVYVTWGVYPTFAKDASFTVNGGSETKVNQSVAPSSTVNGGKWQKIGEATVGQNGVVTVKVTPGTNGYTLADAAMVVLRGNATEGPTCPIPSCAAPPVNCAYAQDSTLNANGCPANPCGILRCDQTENPTCGNGTVESPEQCDDGNRMPGDGCTPACKKETCGDSIVTSALGETCDMGGQNGLPQGGYMCTKQCQWAYCGDGIVQENLGERCDDKNSTNDDDCNNSCQITPKVYCGFPPNAGGTGWQCEQMVAARCAAIGGVAARTNEECFAAAPKTACSDGTDNDGDGAVDLADGGCANAQDDNEADGATDLSIEAVQTESSSVAKGARINSVVTVKNYGPDSMAKGSIRMAVPTGTTYEAGSSSGECVMGNGTVVCTATNLAVNAYTTFSLNFTMAENATCGSSVALNAVVMETPQGDPNMQNNEAGTSVTVSCPTTPQVACESPAATGASNQNPALSVDVSGDGVFDVQDILAMSNYYRTRQKVEGMYYDVDGSGAFDVSDFLHVISYFKCIQTQPSTSSDATISLTSATLSCTGGQTAFQVAYVSKGFTNGKVNIVGPDGGTLNANPVDAGASSTTTYYPEPPANIVPGMAVKVCNANGATPCSDAKTVTGAACATPTAEEKISLASVVLSTEGGAAVAKVTYEKNFDTCAVMTDTSYRDVQTNNPFCQKSGTVTVKLSDGLNVKTGDKVLLCHGNKRGQVCSEPVTVTGTAVTQVDSVTLASVTMSCRDGANYLSVDYAKNFDTCAHAKLPSGAMIGTMSNVYFCKKPGAAVLVPANDLPGITVGSQMKLCHGNNSNVCSPLVSVTGTACAPVSTPKNSLYMTTRYIGYENRPVAPAASRIQLASFDATGVFGMVTLNAFGLRTDNGNTNIFTDYVLTKNGKDVAVGTVSPDKSEVRFSLAGDDAVITDGLNVRFDVYGTVAANAVEGSNVRFALSPIVQAAMYPTNEALSGVAYYQSCPSNQTCRINISGVTSPTFTVTKPVVVTPDPVATGNLYVTQGIIPIPRRQILAGALSEPIMRITLKAEKENIDVTKLRFVSAGGPAASIDRLELVKPGSETAFAYATIAGCSDFSVTTFENNPSQTFCATMENRQLIVPNGQQIDVLVKARVKSDAQGGVSNERIQFVIDIASAGSNAAPTPNQTASQRALTVGFVEARGVASSKTLAHSNGDATANGEIFIGRSTAGENQEIRSPEHVTVLSKIVAISNANPDANGTPVPTGTYPIGQFRFAAADNANTTNGLNKVALEQLRFNVDIRNVSLDSVDFYAYPKADSSGKTRCYVVSGSTVGTSVAGTVVVDCGSLGSYTTENQVPSGQTRVIVLEGRITNAKQVAGFPSSLRVSLTKFSTPETSPGTNNVRWGDRDSSASQQNFTWIEYPETTVSSTLYQG